MGLICLVLWFSVQVCQAATCSADLTYQECQDNNCQVVMGSRRNSNGAYVPPCDLNFNNQFTEECCDPTVASDEHVHYLGCMSPGFVCMIQCMEYVPTGDIYICGKVVALLAATGAMLRVNISAIPALTIPVEKVKDGSTGCCLLLSAC